LNTDPGREGLGCPTFDEADVICDSICTAFGGRCRLVTKAQSRFAEATLFMDTAFLHNCHPFTKELLPSQRKA
jgi:hypothetical protein